MNSKTPDAVAAPDNAPFTTDRLRNIVLDHMLDHSKVFIGDGPDATRKFVEMFDIIEALAKRVAIEAIANRQNLTNLPTFNNMIHADPNTDLHDTTLYEMRYRIVEQVGDDAPFKDDVLSRDEAVDRYGENFINEYWGELGERCPNSATTGDRTLWFSVVRYPVEAQKANQNLSDGPAPYRSPAHR